VSDELARLAQVFCLLVIVATPLLLLYSRVRGKSGQAGSATWTPDVGGPSPPQGHSCGKGATDGGHGGGDCGGGSH
jgi:hypothetical protein